METMPGVFMDLPFYTAGLMDIPTVFFYVLISVLIHDIIHNDLLDKVYKKLQFNKLTSIINPDGTAVGLLHSLTVLWRGSHPPEESPQCSLHMGWLSSQQHDFPL